jgi:hypothetical protein
MKKFLSQDIYIKQKLLDKVFFVVFSLFMCGSTYLILEKTNNNLF